MSCRNVWSANCTLSIVQSGWWRSNEADLSHKSPRTFYEVHPHAQLSARQHKQQAAFFFYRGGESTEKKFVTKPGKFDIDGALTGCCLTGGKPGGAKG